MRLWAEYRYARAATIAFHPDPGKPRALTFDGRRTRDRRAFEHWLIKVFADAGSASLEAELRAPKDGVVQPGDVLIQGGYPGHAVLVLDAAVARGSDGVEHRWVLIGQSYMPAQEFHDARQSGHAGLALVRRGDAGDGAQDARVARLRDARSAPLLAPTRTNQSSNSLSGSDAWNRHRRLVGGCGSLSSRSTRSAVTRSSDSSGEPDPGPPAARPYSSSLR